MDADRKIPQPGEDTATEYLAFISYRHADNTEEDRQWATWLHQQLETYDIPADLIGTTNLHGEVIPQRIYPVFRDEVSLPADADLSSAITGALDRSRFLIVLCSPRAVQSRYVNEEILHFKRTGKADHIMAVLILGEPNASIDEAKLEDPEDARTLECFPKSLQYHVDAAGALDTTQPTEPIAADFRLPGGGKGLTNPQVYKQHLLAQGRKKADAERLSQTYEEQLNTAKLKLVAGILGVRLEQLIQGDRIHQLNKAREASKRFMRIAGLMTVLALAAVAGGGLAYTQWQRAEQEKEIAEDLLGRMRENLKFMNFELRDVLKGYVPQHKRLPILQQIDAMVEALRVYGGQTAEEQRQVAVALVQKADAILDNSALDPAEALQLYQKAQAIIAALVEQDSENAGYQYDMSIAHDKLGMFRWRQGELVMAGEHFEAGLVIARAMAEEKPINAKEQRSLFVSYNRLGIFYMESGDMAAALNNLNAAFDWASAVVGQYPNNAQFQRDLSVSHNALGDYYSRLGEIADALEHFDAGLSILQKMRDRDPRNMQALQSLCVSHNKLGRLRLQSDETVLALEHFMEEIDIARTLVKEDPENTKYKQELFRANSDLGGLRLRLDETTAALEHYEEAMALARGLARQEVGNAEYQKNMYDVHEKLGDFRMRLGEAAVALDHFEAGMEIAKALAKQSPTNTTNQRNLFVAHDSLGDLRLQMGEATAALGHYEAGMEIAMALTKQDPTNTTYQRDLFLTHDSLGDLRLQMGETAAALAHYEAEMEIAKTLAKQEPTIEMYQQDLTSIHSRLGDLRLQMGEATAALDHYEVGMRIAKALAMRDSTNLGYQRNQLVFNDRLGDLRLQQGEVTMALDHYSAQAEIAKVLVKQDPENAVYHRDLSASYNKLAVAYAVKQSYPEAYRQLELTHGVLKDMQESGLLAPDEVQYIDKIQAEMTRLKQLAEEASE